MSIENLYDKVSKTYNQEKSLDVLEKANDFAFDMMQKYEEAFSSILALGIGDGKHVEPYKAQYPKANIAGLDISKGMLLKAKNSLGCETYHGDIKDASQLIQAKTFSYVMAHFVCAYVKPEIVLREAHQLLAPGGYVSVVNNTFESFPTLWSLYEKYLSKKGILRHRVKHHINKAMSTVHAPKDLDTLKKDFEQQGFEVVDVLYQGIDISLESYQECYEFFVNGGWFLSGLVHPFVPERALRFLFQQMIKLHFALPYKDTLKIAVVIGKKK
jgi:ubiquinone/menaquinone biosynthesis C-methylase UbiE